MKGSLVVIDHVLRRDESELPGDNDVGLSRSADAARTGELMKIIMDMGRPDFFYERIGDPTVWLIRRQERFWCGAKESDDKRSTS